MNKIRLFLLSCLAFVLVGCAETKSQCWHIDPNSKIEPSEACPLSKDITDEAASAEIVKKQTMAQNYRGAIFVDPKANTKNPLASKYGV